MFERKRWYGGGGYPAAKRWCEMESMKIQVNKKMLMQVVYTYGWHWFHTYTHTLKQICRFVWYLQGEKLPLGFSSGECFSSRKRHTDLWLWVCEEMFKTIIASVRINLIWDWSFFPIIFPPDSITKILKFEKKKIADWIFLSELCFSCRFEFV